MREPVTKESRVTPLDGRGGERYGYCPDSVWRVLATPAGFPRSVPGERHHGSADRRGRHDAWGQVAIKLATMCSDTVVERFAREVGVLRDIELPDHPCHDDFRVTPTRGVYTVEEVHRRH